MSQKRRKMKKKVCGVPIIWHYTYVIHTYKDRCTYVIIQHIQPTDHADDTVAAHSIKQIAAYRL